MSRTRITFQHLLVIAILSGCAVGTDYRAPEISVPQAWHAALGGGG